VAGPGIASARPPASAFRAGALALLLLGSALPAPLAAQSEPPPPAPAVRVWRTGGLKLETAGLLLSGQQGGDLPIAVLATPLPAAPGGDGATPVALRVEVSGPVLLAVLAGAAERPALRLDFAVYALGPAGDLEGSIADTVEIKEIDLGQLVPRLLQAGVAFSAGLRLPAGEHSLRVLVRQPEGGAMGLRILPLAVPAAAGMAPRLLTPLFPSSGAGEAAWVEARAASAAPAEAGAPRAARPVLDLDQESAFELPALRLAEPEPALRVELLAAGAVAADLPGRLAPRSGARDGVQRLAASFIPRGLAPGAYELRAVLVAGKDAGGGELRLRSPALPVILAKGGAGQVWARIERAAPDPGQDAAGAGPPGTPAGMLAGTAAPGTARPRAPISGPSGRPGRSGQTGGAARRWRGQAGPLLASYHQALADLAAGRADAARDAVAKLERQLLRDRQASREDLESFESDALAPIARANPEALVPVLRLYELLYLGDCDERAFDLATHAREMFFAVAEVYLKLSRADGARRLTARLLTILAGAMEGRCGAGGAAERAFRRAMALDPKYETPRLCLAVLAERHGAYRAEISLLEPVVRDHPDQGEARLRLALALQRSGDGRGARRQLEELVRLPPGAAGWALPVAYQELAKLLLAGDEAAAAEVLLREALGRFPADEKLGLLLSLVLEAAGKREAAREAVEAIEAIDAAPAMEPRHRYTQLPGELLRRDAEEEPAWVGERLAGLASALDASRAGKR
jgi:hypothetical protein